MPIYSGFSVTAIYQNIQITFNPLNAELNPIYHLVALFSAHPIFHVSRIRVKLLSVTYSDVARFFEARSEITNLKKSQLSIKLFFIWVNNLNFIESTQSIFFFPYLKHSFAVYCISAKFVSVAFVFLTRWYLMFMLTFTQLWLKNLLFMYWTGTENAILILILIFSYLRTVLFCIVQKFVWKGRDFWFVNQIKNYKIESNEKLIFVLQVFAVPAASEKRIQLVNRGMTVLRWSPGR